MAGEGDIDAVATAAALASSDSASGASQEAENGALFATQGDETECVYGPFLEGGCKLISLAPERECTTCQEKGVQRWFHHCCKEEACDEMFKRRDPEQYRAFKNQEIENSSIANPHDIPLFLCPNCHPNFPIGGLKRGDEDDEDDEDDQKVNGEKVDGEDKFDGVDFDDDDDDDDGVDKNDDGAGKPPPYVAEVLAEHLLEYEPIDVTATNYYNPNDERCLPIVLMAMGIGVSGFPPPKEIKTVPAIFKATKRSNAQLFNPTEVSAIAETECGDKSHTNNVLALARLTLRNQKPRKLYVRNLSVVRYSPCQTNRSSCPPK